MNKFNLLGRTFTEGVWGKLKAVVTAKPEDRLSAMMGDKQPVVASTLTKGAKAAKKIMDNG